MKIHLKYAVIILNYNSTVDLIKAIDSLENAKSSKMGICIVDNLSNETNRLMLKSWEKSNVYKNIKIYYLDVNKGYAYGNNYGFNRFLDIFDFDYTVIMNPDVHLISKNTVENIISQIESYHDDTIVGGQPLVWNYKYPEKANEQINIRKVFSFFDVCIDSNLILRMFFVRRFKKTNYLFDIPYNNNLFFEVPSGAFFIINTTCFKKISLFDENTFLYEEELILGYKLKKNNYKMLFVPCVIVKHSQGSSTNFKRYSISKEKVRILYKSKCQYLKYIGINILRKCIIKLLLWSDYYTRKLVVLIFKLAKKEVS